jgi:hypothetical protein
MALLTTPLADLSVVAGEQDARNRPAAMLGGTRVVGVFGSAVERGAERLLDG